MFKPQNLNTMQFQYLLPALLCLCFSSSLFAQNKTVENFYDHYNQLENVTDVKLQGWLLKMAAEFSDEEEATRILQNISFLRVLVMSEGNLVKPQDLKTFIRDLKKDAFENLMQIRNEGARVEILIREDGDTITDVVALINSDEESFILLSLEGRIRFSDLNNLHIDVEGLEHFKKIPEKRSDIPRA